MSLDEEELKKWIEQVTKKLAHLEANQIAIINGDFCGTNTVPKEPLIKDEDARDAVYSWASSLQVHEVRCKKTVRGVEVITLEALKLMSAPRIEFACYSINANVTDGGIYTIDELCGEDEE